MSGLHYGSDPEEESGEDDDYTALAKEAFPDEEWTPDRVSALRHLIKMCGMGDEESADDDEEDTGKHKAPGIALIFGGKPKK